MTIVQRNKSPLQVIPKPDQYSVAVTQRDGTCRVSSFNDCTETAHLVPWIEDGWVYPNYPAPPPPSTNANAPFHTQFTRNEMEIYNLNAGLPSELLTSDVNNCLRLRNDIHSQLDSGNFVFVPKCGTSCIHFLTPTQEYGRLLHNRKTEEFYVAPEFVYARFAWAVLPLAQAFAAKVGVKLRVWDVINHTWKETLRGPIMPPEPMLPLQKRPRIKSLASGAAQDAPRGKLGGPPNAGRTPAPPSPNSHERRKRTLDQLGPFLSPPSLSSTLLTPVSITRPRLGVGTLRVEPRCGTVWTHCPRTKQCARNRPSARGSGWYLMAQHERSEGRSIIYAGGAASGLWMVYFSLQDMIY